MMIPEITRREFLKITGGTAAGVSLMPLNGLFAQPQQTKDYIHMGCTLALSGGYSKVTAIYKDAYEFYMETVNRKMTVAGKAYPLKLTVYDDENRPSKAAELMEKLIVSDKVDLILSSYGTDPILAQSSVCKRYNRILINAGAATQKIDEEFAGTAFTLISSGAYYHRTLVAMAAELDPPIKTVGIITPDDIIYHEISKAVKEDCQKNGMEVVIEDVVPMNVSDLEPTVLKMKPKQPDMVVNTGWDKILASFVNMARKHDLKLKFLDGGHATITPFLKMALGTKLKHICGVTFFMPEAKTKDHHYGDSLTFAKEYTEKYGYEPAYHAAMAYTIPCIYEVILKHANPEEPFNTDFLRRSLSAMDDEMLWGRIRFNEKGRIVKDMLVIQWQGDPPVPVIVYPPESATGNLIYPSDPLAG